MENIIYMSYGYDMTINNYAKIIKETAKTVVAVPIARIVQKDDGRGGGESMPDPTKVTGEPFRLYKRGDYYGDYSKWNGKPNYYNTWD